MKKVFYLLSLFLLFSCSKEQKKNQLKLSVNRHPTTLDARKSGDIPSSVFLFMLFKGLTELKKDGKIHPSLAEHYEISEDKKTYIFYLRDAQWSNGKKVTAHDMEYSWKKILDPNFPSLCPHLFYSIKNAEKAKKGEISLDKVGFYAKDDKTFVVHLKNPTPYFLFITSFCISFPVPEGIDEQFPNWENDPKTYISNGPFRLKKIEHNKKILVEKNPFYWDKDKISLDSIKTFIISNENTNLQMFENNELDWIGTYTSPLPIDSIPYILKKKEHIIQPIGGTTFCTFNTEKFPFTNKNIRKAFGLSINRTAIVQNITQAKEIIATRILPPILMNKKNITLFKDNQIEEAQKYLQKGLKELGKKKEDLKIIFTFSSDIIHKKIAEALQENWQKVLNVKVKLVQLEKEVMHAKIHEHNFQAALIWWLAQYPDASNILNRFQYKTNKKNYPNWENKDFIKVLKKARKMIDDKKRMQYLEKAEAILAEEMPISTIYHHNFIALANPKLKNIYYGPIAELHYDEIFIR